MLLKEGVSQKVKAKLWNGKSRSQRGMKRWDLIQTQNKMGVNFNKEKQLL